MTERFSTRHGYHHPSSVSITVRQDAPYELRGVLIQIAYECGFRPTTLRSLVCQVLRKRPDPNNWSEYPNVNHEVHELIDECDWYRVYDIIEAIAAKMNDAPFSYEAAKFEREINDYFIEKGIGWKIDGGMVDVRGPEAFEEAVREADDLMESNKLLTAQNELREALRDLSRRPNADVTGAIQHSMAALECVAREITGDGKSTLGEVMKRNQDIIPRPLDEAVTKIWGYASENARHIREGREPAYEDAELTVSVASAVSTYLLRKRDA